jgi:hypothetical protein
VTSVDVNASCAFDFFTELSTDPGLGALPLHREAVQGDVADLVEEAFVTAVMAERLPSEVDELDVVVTPVWDRAPRAEAVDVTLTERGGGRRSLKRRFESGRWMRTAQERTLQLASDGVLSEGATAYVHLLAEARSSEPLPLPLLQTPVITTQSVEELGVCDLGSGKLCPDRPVLVNDRMVDEIVHQAELAGARETGGGALGKMIRIEEPLPGTTTRIVTVLSAARDLRSRGPHGGGRRRLSARPGRDGAHGVPLARLGHRVRTMQPESALRPPNRLTRVTGRLPCAGVALSEQGNRHAHRGAEARGTHEPPGPRSPRVEGGPHGCDPLALISRLSRRT